MKYTILPFLLLVLLFAGCDSKVNNQIEFKNLAAAVIHVNFRGQDITVESGEYAIIKEIQRGTYKYKTTYGIPSGAISSTEKGDVSGTIVIKAGTSILVLYSSTLVNGAYTISATISSSDDETNPINP